MEIPDPVANHGEAVMVHNYRSKPKDGTKLWERGTVKRLAYKNSFGGFDWHYGVLLDRRSASDNPIWLYVGDEGIRRITL